MYITLFYLQIPLKLDKLKMQGVDGIKLRVEKRWNFCQDGSRVLTMYVRTSVKILEDFTLMYNSDAEINLAVIMIVIRGLYLYLLLPLINSTGTCI